jgi:hypothetical protein
MPCKGKKKTLKVMKISTLTNFKYWLLLPAIAFMLACNYAKPQLTPDEIWSVQGQVGDLTKKIATDVSAKGPGAWLNYMQDTSYFFLANDGELALKDYKSASKFIKDTLVNSISKETLQWSNMRIDPLSNSVASIGCNFHEDITHKDSTLSYNGYFTAIAVLVNDEWKLRNMHWSEKTTGK